MHIDVAAEQALNGRSKEHDFIVRVRRDQQCRRVALHESSVTKPLHHSTRMMRLASEARVCSSGSHVAIRKPVFSCALRAAPSPVIECIPARERRLF